MATDTTDSRQSDAPPSIGGAGAFLPPIVKPKGLRKKLLYRFLGREFGKAPGWLTVFGARVPFGFTSWMGKVYSLNKKLELPQDTERLVRAQVSRINGCAWCMDAEMWAALEKTPDLVPRIEALHGYRASPLFSDRERAALDFATELTERKHVTSEAFAELSRHYSEREISEIVWVVSTNHMFNINNIGLGVGSDGLCELRRR